MKVTGVKPQKKRDRYNLFVDGIFRYGVSGNVVAKFGLYKDKVLEEEDLRAIFRFEIYYKLYDRCIAKIARRPHSRKELLNYIKQTLYKKKVDWFKGVSEPFGAEIEDIVPDQLLDDLESKSIISDAAFAEWWVESRSRSRPKGWVAVKAELQAKGVSREIIDSLQGDGDESELAERAYLRAFRGRLPKFEKAVSRLRSRGFSWDVIEAVLKKHNIKREYREMD